MEINATNLLLVGVVTAGLLGCGGDDSTAGTQSTTSATTSVTADESPAVEIDCPNSEGGSCLGEIPAGTYTTPSFRPSITYTVPDG